MATVSRAKNTWEEEHKKLNCITENKAVDRVNTHNSVVELKCTQNLTLTNGKFHT
jgi:hypothetical protein